MREANNVPSVRSNAHRSSDACVFVILNDDKSVRESLESPIAGAGQPRSFNAPNAFLACPRLMIPNCVVSDTSPPDLYACARTAASHIPARVSSGSLKQINPGRLSVGYAKAGPSEGAAVVLPHRWPYHVHSFVDIATSEMSQVA